MLRSGCPWLVIQAAWAWFTGTQLTTASATAALDSGNAAARALRRNGARPGTADEESFTAAWRQAVRSMQSSQVTATSSVDAIAAGESAARPYRETAGRRIRARLLLSQQPPPRPEGGNRPALAGPTTRGTARRIHGDTRAAAMPAVTLKPAQGHNRNINTLTI